MPDQLQVAEVAHSRAGSHHEWMLREAVRAMHSVGDEAAERYDRALASLSSADRQAVDAAAAALQEAAGDPMLRWSIVRVVGQIRTESAVALLHEQGIRALQPHDPAGGCEQPADVEVLISVMAVEGLAAQAGAGLDSAIDALLDVLSAAPAREVSRVAGTSLVRLRPDLEGQVRDQLGPDAGLLDLRPAVARDLMPHGDVSAEPPDDDGPHGEKPPLAGKPQGDSDVPRAGAGR